MWRLSEDWSCFSREKPCLAECFGARSRDVRTQAHPMKYPMWVISVGEFLQQSGVLSPHQELCDADIIRTWSVGMRAIFVSHQWLSASHPDPRGEQMKVLQNALEYVIDDPLAVQQDFTSQVTGIMGQSMSWAMRHSIAEGFLWIDWCGIPQITVRSEGMNDNPELNSDAYLAVQSIPAYVEACEDFWVLSPELMHKDTEDICNYVTWLSRGWCRAELLCRALCLEDCSVILVMSGACVQHVMPMDWILSPPGEGDFTVESDRECLLPILKRALDVKLKHHEEEGNAGILHHRFFKALRPQILKGLGAGLGAPGLRHHAVSGVLQIEDNGEWQIAFREKYRFQSLNEHGAGGFGPGMAAALGGDESKLQYLLDCKVDLCQPLTIDVPDLFLMKGMTPLMLATMLSKTEAVQALLDAGIDLASNAAGLLGLTPLHVAFSEDCARLLIESGFSVNARNNLQQTPLAVLAHRCSPGVAELLLENEACVNSEDFLGLTPLHGSAVHEGSCSTASMLIKYRADVNAIPRKTFVSDAMVAGARLWVNLGSQSLIARYIAEVPGLTPLGMAAFFGRIQLSRLLLEARADPKSKNANGHTPVDLARLGRNDFMLDEQHNVFAVDNLEEVTKRLTWRLPLSRESTKTEPPAGSCRSPRELGEDSPIVRRGKSDTHLGGFGGSSRASAREWRPQLSFIPGSQSCRDFTRAGTSPRFPSVGSDA